MKPTDKLIKQFKNATPDELALLCVENHISPIFINGPINYYKISPGGGINIHRPYDYEDLIPGKQIGIELKNDDRQIFTDKIERQLNKYQRLQYLDYHAKRMFGDHEVVLCSDKYNGTIKIFTQEDFTEKYYKLQREMFGAPQQSKTKLAEYMIPKNCPIYIVDPDSLLSIEHGKISLNLKFKPNSKMIEDCQVSCKQYLGQDEKLLSDSQLINLKGQGVYQLFTIGQDVILTTTDAIYTTMDCVDEMYKKQQQEKSLQPLKEGLAKKFAGYNYFVDLLSTESSFKNIDGNKIELADLKSGDRVKIAAMKISNMGVAQSQFGFYDMDTVFEDAIIKDVWYQQDGKDFIVETSPVDQYSDPNTTHVYSTINFAKEYCEEKEKFLSADKEHKVIREELAQSFVGNEHSVVLFGNAEIRNPETKELIDFSEIKEGMLVQISGTHICNFDKPEISFNFHSDATVNVESITIDGDKFAIECQGGLVISTIDFTQEYQREAWEEEMDRHQPEESWENEHIQY